MVEVVMTELQWTWMLCAVILLALAIIVAVR